MPLVTLNEMVIVPGQGWALGAFNTFNMEMTEAILEVAVEEHAPVIIMIYVPFFKSHGKALVPMIRALAQDLKVPVCLHLDHARNFGDIVEAIRMGFSSVMIDASELPIADNIALTKKIVDVAHACNVSVEAELGYVPVSGQCPAGKAAELKTDPYEALRFVAETGVDALAVSVGNVHSGKPGTASIDIKLISEIRKKISCMLVLHGGTALGPKAVKEVVRAGIDKINFFTDLRRAYNRGLSEVLCKESEDADPERLISNAKHLVKEIIREKLRLVNSVGNVDQ